MFAIESANIVGYGHFEVPSNYSIWSPVFKSISTATFDLNAITPTTLKQVAIAGDAKVSIFKLSTDGSYEQIYKWCPATCGGWSADNGATKIEDGVVTLARGEGFAMVNLVKCTSAGVESTARTAVASPIAMLVSGEVDLVCKNVVPSNYSISGNATPIAIDLTDIIPTTLAGVTIAGDAKVSVFKLGTDGSYEQIYKWCPATCGGWSADNGASAVEKGVVTFNPGEGFAMVNLVKVTSSGVESTARTATASPIYMSLPSPVK